MAPSQIARVASKPANGAAYQMIRSIEVSNFRCYKSLKLEGFSAVNVIVGENGSGKTALLESIFMPLGTSTELGMRLRQLRGLDPSLGGTPQGVDEALWGDYFYHGDMSQSITLTLHGDGADDRSLVISRGGGGAVLAFPDGSAGEARLIPLAPLVFTWQDAQRHSRSVVPQMTAQGMMMPGTGEVMQDFFFFSAQSATSSIDTASRFSTLSKKGQSRRFVETLVKEFPWISDLTVEVHGGSPVLFGTLGETGEKLPLPNISSGINRIVAVLLAIASSPRTVVMVDEIENGIYYSHLQSIWKALLAFSSEYQCQLVISSHSLECLRALNDAIGTGPSDLSIFRTERGPEGIEIERFQGKYFRRAMQFEQEIR